MFSPKKLLFTILLFFTCINVYPQTQKVHFNYDAAGNREQRYIEVTVACRKSKDSLKVDSTKGNQSLVNSETFKKMQDSLNIYSNNLKNDSLAALNTLGELNENHDFGIFISPNPASKTLNIDVRGNGNEKRLPYIFFDMRGRIYVKSTLLFSKNEIDLNDFADGIYYLMIQTEDSRMKEKIVVVK